MYAGAIGRAARIGRYAMCSCQQAPSARPHRRVQERACVPTRHLCALLLLLLLLLLLPPPPLRRCCALRATIRGGRQLWSLGAPASLRTFTGHTYCVYHVAW